MFISVSDALKSPGQSFPFSASTEFEAFEFAGDMVEFKNILIKGVMVGTGEAVHVSAAVTADAHTRCSRCLEPMVLPLKAEIEGDFLRTPDPEDPDVYELTGYRIDPDPLVRDALIPELPMRFICKDDCKGLCPVCGANRNLVSCTCHEGIDETNPFSALKDLLSDEEV